MANCTQLTPGDCILILVNYQTKFAFTIDSRNVPALIRNAVCLAKIAKHFEIPTVMTTIGVNTFGGPLLPQLQMIYSNQDPIECNTLSIWENRTVYAALEKAARKKIVMAGLWTNFSVALSTIRALQSGYEVYIVSDACAELNDVDNDLAIKRMIEAGAVTLDCSKILLDFQTYQALKDPINPDSELIREMYSTQ